MPSPTVLTPVTIPRQASPVQSVMAAASANSSSSTATAAVLASLRQRHGYASQGSPLLPLGQLPQQQPQQLLQQLPQQESPIASRRWGALSILLDMTAIDRSAELNVLLMHSLADAAGSSNVQQSCESLIRHVLL